MPLEWRHLHAEETEARAVKLISSMLNCILIDSRWVFGGDMKGVCLRMNVGKSGVS